MRDGERAALLADVAGPLLDPPASTSLSAAHGALPGLWDAAERARAAPTEMSPLTAVSHPPISSCCVLCQTNEKRCVVHCLLCGLLSNSSTTLPHAVRVALHLRVDGCNFTL